MPRAIALAIRAPKTVAWRDGVCHASVQMTAAGDGALDQSGIRALLEQLGVPVLRKPFEIQELVDAVAAAAARLLDGTAAIPAAG